jgi:transposase
MDIEISASYVRKIRHEIGYKGVSPIYRPHLTLEQEERRYNYCYVHRDDLFRNVFFIDECSICLNEKGALVWYKPSYEVKPTKEYGDAYATVMMGAGISYRGKSYLHFYDAGVNGISYSDFLREVLIPRARSLYGNRFRILQDTAPAHRSKLVTELYEDEEIHKIEWPGYLPDLNAIELAWGFLKFQLSKVSILTLHDLRENLRDIWASIDKEHIQAWIDYIPERVQIVLENNGRFI